jgi:hypothetical protein
VGDGVGVTVVVGVGDGVSVAAMTVVVSDTWAPPGLACILVTATAPGDAATGKFTKTEKVLDCEVARNTVTRLRLSLQPGMATLQDWLILIVNVSSVAPTLVSVRSY